MTAEELFSICQTLAERPASAGATRRMHELLVLACAEGCRRQGGAFGGLFAQLDFLCKRHGIAAGERRELQTMRCHSNSGDAVDAAEWLYDLRALSLLLQKVFATDVPGALRRLLPPQPRPHAKGLRVNLEHVRCVVQRWTDSHIVVTTDEGELTVDYGCTDEGRDFGYLRRVLREDMQLNLLDCHVQNDGETGVPTVTPAQIVVEPDFLVDISAVAACFTNYGHHPLLYTLNRLKPKANTQAILLGNFAGTALDDIVDTDNATLSQSLRRSFREQALRFCACEDFDAQQFKTDARRQVENIGQAVGMLFGTAGTDRREHADTRFESDTYDRSKALLEPSFVCERLGLQGRVDLMTSDLRLLVEQKSGRNPKIEHRSNDSHGRQMESHYVQLLLYYGILRYNFGRSRDQVDIRLLYSRYAASEGLLSVAYYQQLLREALRLRNQIVATELLIARDGFGRVMPLLNAETIYRGVATDSYFHRYVRPEADALARQLDSLTPVERAYYERMMTFVYREQCCQKLGSSEGRLHHSGGANSDLWLMPTSEKQLSGNIFMGLTIDKLQRSTVFSGFDLVRLRLDGGLGGQENFRRGDMVLLYAYDEQPDVRRSILYKGTLDDMGTDTISVRLTNGQQSTGLFSADKRRWAVEHASADTGTTAAIRSLHQLTAASADRRQLLLGQRPPQADTRRQPSRSYHTNYDAAVRGVVQSLDYFLLVGPPGTGKTSMAMRFMVDEELSRKDEGEKAVLLMSYTNRAVDEICAMLDTAGHDYLRLGNEASCEARFRSHLLETALAGVSRLDDMRLRIARTPIIVGTTQTMQLRQEIFQLKHFSLCIVDEASQILEPNIVGLLSRREIGRFVLIGDHKQLPAVVQQGERESHTDNPLLCRLCIDDCRQSLFERLLRWEQRCGRTQFVATLRHQGRMHPLVAQFPAQAFYGGEQLEAVPLPHQQALSLGYELPARDRLDSLLQQRRVLFFDRDEWCPQPEGQKENDDRKETGDQASAQEARLVATLSGRIARFYGERFDAEKTVGVIVPYRTQIAAIRRELALQDCESLQRVSIDTVERYQGSQRDVIVYSFTVSHQYQLDFLSANTFSEHGQSIDRKLNVALTRARCQMLMVGSSSVLCQNPLFARLIEAYAIRRS